MFQSKVDLTGHSENLRQNRIGSFMKSRGNIGDYLLSDGETSGNYQLNVLTTSHTVDSFSLIKNNDAIIFDKKRFGSFSDFVIHYKKNPLVSKKGERTFLVSQITRDLLEGDGIVEWPIVYKEGILIKRPSQDKLSRLVSVFAPEDSWRPRRFVLENGKMNYYKLSTGKRRGVINLNNCTRCYECTEGSWPNCFKLEENINKTWVLSASSERERQEWIASINSFLQS